MKWTLKDKNKYIRHIKVTLKTWFSCLAASSLQTFYDERNIGTRHTWMKYLIKIKSPYNQSFSRKIYVIHYFYTKDINRWYCQLFIRNSKLRWKGKYYNTIQVYQRMVCLIVFYLRSVNNGCRNFSKTLKIFRSRCLSK